MDKTSRPVALITGASQRIGATIARVLHQQNYNIIIHYRTSTDAATQLQSELNQLRENSCQCLQADFDKESDINQLCQQVASHGWQRLDLLVNNASSFFSTPIHTIDLTDWDNLFNSNAKAPLLLSQGLAHLLETHRGSIINLIDIHANRPLKNHTVYCMAKSALQMMTLSLAKELAPAIRVNGVAPGAILWPKSEETMSADEKNDLLAEIPMQALGKPEDIAETIAFLASARYITGQIIAVDGGRSL